MHLDPRQHGADRRRAQIRQRGHRRTDQDDLVLQAARRDPVLEDIGDGHIRKAEPRAPVRNQRGSVFIDRYLERSDLERFQAAIPVARRDRRQDLQYDAAGALHQGAENGE